MRVRKHSLQTEVPTHRRWDDEGAQLKEPGRAQVPARPCQRLFDTGLIIYPSLGLSFLIWKCGSEYFHALAVLWIITSIIYVRIKV